MPNLLPSFLFLKKTFNWYEVIKFRTRYERQFLDVGCIDLAISNGGAEMHQWDTPTVCIGPLSMVVEGVKLLLIKPGVEKK